MAFIEPILQEEKDRFVIFPIKHHDIWDWYKKMEANFCAGSQIDLQDAISEGNEILNNENVEFIKKILSYFIISHSVEKDFTRSLSEEIKFPEARFFFDLKSVQDNLHLGKWSFILNSLVKDKIEQEQILKSAENLPSEKAKLNWVQKWVKSDSFSEKLIAFAAVERIFYSGSSCSIQLLKNERFPQLNIFNDLFLRDKNLNSDFAVFLHKNHLINRVPKVRIREIILEALDSEREFISEFIPENQTEINRQSITEYSKFIADNLLTELNCEPEFGREKPVDFADSNSELLAKRVEELQRKFKKGKSI